MPTIALKDQFMGGISDDHHYINAGEVEDMENVDVWTSPRSVRLSAGFQVSGSALDGVGEIVSLTSIPEQSNYVLLRTDTVFLGTVNKTTLYTGNTYFDKYINIGGNYDAYNPTANPNGFRHFIFDRFKIYVSNFAMDTLEPTIDISGLANDATTSVVKTQDNTLLFARQNLIYALNTITYSISTTPIVTLPQGSRVKYMYMVNGNLTVVSTFAKRTYFHTIRRNAGEYTIDYENELDYECISAVGSNGMIYWISSEGIHQWSGNNQFVKSLQTPETNYYTFPSWSFSNNAILSMNKGILQIADGSKLWKYGSVKPGYRNILVRDSSLYSILAMDKDMFVLDRQASGQFIYNRAGYAHIATPGYIITSPFDAESFSDKRGLALRIPVEMKATYTDPEYKIQINVYIMTDSMRYANNAIFLKVGEITSEIAKEIIINKTQIAKTLETAGYSDIWRNVRIKFELIPGDFSASAQVCSETPLLYNDFKIQYEETTQDF